VFHSRWINVYVEFSYHQEQTTMDQSRTRIWGFFYFYLWVILTGAFKALVKETKNSKFVGGTSVPFLHQKAGDFFGKSHPSNSLNASDCATCLISYLQKKKLWERWENRTYYLHPFPLLPSPIGPKPTTTTNFPPPSMASGCRRTCWPICSITQHNLLATLCLSTSINSKSKGKNIFKLQW